MIVYRNIFITLLIAVTGLIVCSWQIRQVAPIKPQSKKPNIILILADDMDYSDIGCYGGEAATPNLDLLAKRDIRYTQFYNIAWCYPSRASLMTGLDPYQAGMGWMTTDDFNLPGYRGYLSHNAVTIAEVLQTAGYATYMAGKWHLNFRPTPTSIKENWPPQRGFDQYYGTIFGAANYFDPGFLCRDNQLINTTTDSVYKPDHYYFTDAISDNSVRYIQKRNKSKPMFLYLAVANPQMVKKMSKMWETYALRCKIYPSPLEERITKKQI